MVVDYGQRSDGDLVELAQAGWRGAFAVLVHRHAPTIHTAVLDDPDPVASTVEVFTDAMRGLPARDPSQPVLPWLLSLAGTQTTPAVVHPLHPDLLDDIWRRLDARWPDGHRHGLSHGSRISLLVAGLVVASILIPVAVFAISTMPTEVDPEAELQAFPIAVDIPPPAAEEQPEPLPTFTFPVPPEEQEQEPAQDAAPSPPPAAPEPSPPPATEEPQPEPTEGDAEGSDEEDGDEGGGGLPLPLPGGGGGDGGDGGGDGGSGDGDGDGGDGGGGGEGEAP